MSQQHDVRRDYAGLCGRPPLPSSMLRPALGRRREVPLDSIPKQLACSTPRCLTRRDRHIRIVAFPRQNPRLLVDGGDALPVERVVMQVAFVSTLRVELVVALARVCRLPARLKLGLDDASLQRSRC